MALSADTPLVQELGNIGEYPVKASTKIFEGAVVGLYAAAGHARGLVAGDLFLGFAESQADNSAGGSGGEINVRTLQRGAAELAVAGAAITDVGTSVYATDDGTYSFTGQEESRVGVVARFVSSGVVLVKFDALVQVGLGLGS